MSFFSHKSVCDLPPRGSQVGRDLDSLDHIDLDVSSSNFLVSLIQKIMDVSRI